VFACLHGTGNLTALAFEFSPIVEATGALNGFDTVTFDVSGLDRLFRSSSGCRSGDLRIAPARIGSEGKSGARRKSRCGHLCGSRIPRL
jgi:hypothetical protein